MEMEKQQQKPKKKLNRKLIWTLIIIISGFLIYTIYLDLKGTFEDSINPGSPGSFWTFPSFFLSAVAILGAFLLVGFWAKKKGILWKLEEIGNILLYNLWFPFAIIVLFLLGAIHTSFPYESHWAENMTHSFGTLGGIGVKLYDIGAVVQWYWWVLILLGYIYFAFDEIKDVCKSKKRDNKDNNCRDNDEDNNGKNKNGKKNNTPGNNKQDK